VEAIADKMLTRIYSTFSMNSLQMIITSLGYFFRNSYSNIVVNQNQIKQLKEICNTRKGPIIFCPTHRSYVDFLVLSTILYYEGMEVPLICSGEDFLNIAIVADILRSSGAFFMRRTFKGDALYKAVFYEYVRNLCKDHEIMEFFIEGTRSRTNKMIIPKYGFMSVCSRVFFEKEVEDITFVPVTLNYTRTLEGETFPGELRGE
jgi:glycerol-3-phosphate O-acyltransferase